MKKNWIISGITIVIVMAIVCGAKIWITPKVGYVNNYDVYNGYDMARHYQEQLERFANELGKVDTLYDVGINVRACKDGNMLGDKNCVRVFAIDKISDDIGALEQQAAVVAIGHGIDRRIFAGRVLRRHGTVAAQGQHRENSQQPGWQASKIHREVSREKAGVG